MARIALPPTPLASGLVATLAIHALPQLGEVEAEVRREEGFLSMSIDVEQRRVVKSLVRALEKPAMWGLEHVYGALPLIFGRGPGTDGGTIGDLFAKAGLSVPSLRAEARPKLYDELVRIVGRDLEALGRALQSVSISVSRGVFKISLGGDDHPVPVIIKSEAFYEIGRFGGLSDRKRGRPDIGRIDYRAAAPVTGLLYALLLALQTGYERGVTNTYMFTLLSLEPGSITTAQAELVKSLYRALRKDILRIGFRVWLRDYEGLRLVSIIKLLEELEKLRKQFKVSPPSNVALNHLALGVTGRRFFPLWNVQISLSEISTVARIVESFSRELGVENLDRVLKLLRLLIVASLDIASRSTNSSAQELWVGVRALAHSFIEGRKHELLDTLYRMMRLLSDHRTGLRAEVIGSMSNAAQALEMSLADAVLEPSKDVREGLWKSIRTLVTILTK